VHSACKALTNFQFDFVLKVLVIGYRGRSQLITVFAFNCFSLIKNYQVSILIPLLQSCEKLSNNIHFNVDIVTVSFTLVYNYIPE